MPNDGFKDRVGRPVRRRRRRVRMRRQTDRSILSEVEEGVLVDARRVSGPIMRMVVDGDRQSLQLRQTLQRY